jgi:hypothetical protein
MNLCYALFLSLGSLVSTVGAVSEHETSSHSPCTHLSAPKIPGAEVISINGTEKWNYTVAAIPQLLPYPIYGLDFCEINVVLTHPNADDRVLVQVWLPLRHWNGRFQATGGSGWAAGTFDATLGPAVQLGYSSASTDAGVSRELASPGEWALRQNGTVNWDALTNFAHRSVHDMGLVGQDITAQFYGKKAEYSYWNGCSTGGRQAMAAAQRYPEIFDGILAGAPAINWATYVVAEQWPQVVMEEEGTFPSQCELKYFRSAAIEQCDELDGIKDGVITDPDSCNFDPYRLVGKQIQCEGASIKICESTARVVEKILQGPFSSSGEPLWYGLNTGAALDSLANTTVTNDRRIGFPLFVNDNWIKYWLAKDPTYNTSTISYETLQELFSQSKAEYDEIIGTDNPDLSAFHNAGGKLIVWQGLADQLIFPKGTIDYRERVERLMGGSSKVDDFFRLFFAPGVDHCGGDATLGAMPNDILGALVTWVEQKKTPNTLPATLNALEGQKMERILCPYPQVSKYVGGDKSSSRSFRCV